MGNIAYHECPGRFCGELEGYLNFIQEYSMFSPILRMFIMFFGQYCTISPVHENTCKLRAKTRTRTRGVDFHTRGVDSRTKTRTKYVFFLVFDHANF